MNIFTTSDCPRRSAEALDDQRVVKMILESIQLMGFALNARGCPEEMLPKTKDGKAYKSMGPHANHPCALWTGETRGNFNWLLAHTKWLIIEKRIRYPTGSTEHYTRALLTCKRAADYIPNGPQKDFVNCSKHGTADQIFNYRMTMIWKWEESRKNYSKLYIEAFTYKLFGMKNLAPRKSVQLPKWTNRDEPAWYEFLRTRCAWQRVEVSVKK